LRLVPSHVDYLSPDLRDSPWTRLDLERELAAAYLRNGSLDPSGEKCKAVVKDLHAGKLTARVKRDLAAVQRYHVTLGLILADQKVWASLLPWRSAIYQLSRAKAIAKRRENEDKAPYQPLSEVKANLADGYLATGARSQAARTYLEAAEAYLDTDELDRSRDMLKRSRSSSNGQFPASLLRVEKALVGIQRERALLLQVKTVDTESPLLQWCKSGVPLQRANFYSRDFHARQRFKIAADIAEKAGSASQTLSSRCAAVALDTAAMGVSTLVGTADMLRLERTQFQTQRKLLLKSSGQDSMTVAPPATFKGKAWPVYLPSQRVVPQVRITEDHVLANKASLLLDQWDETEISPVWVDAGRITIYQRGTSTDREKMLGMLQKALPMRKVSIVDPGDVLGR
jgi:hypothetical protein